MDYLQIHELYHHGIKGQRWGIRRYQNEDGSLTAEGKQRYQINEYDGSMSKAGKKLYKQDMHAAKKEYKKSLTKEQKLANRNAVANATVGGLKGAAITYAGTVAAAAAIAGISYLALRKAANNPSTIRGMEQAGSILGKSTTALNLTGAAYKIGMPIGAAAGASIAVAKQQKARRNVEKKIEHSGIKGQKWGVRRFQNEDGSLTAAGKERYSKNDPTPSRDINESNRQLTALGAAAKGTQNITRDIQNLVPDRKGKTIRKNYPDLSDQELRNRVNRLSLERSYSDLVGDTKYKKSGNEYVREALQTIGSIAGIAVSATVIAKAINDFGKKGA